MDKVIELKEKYAIVYFPEDAVEVEIVAKVYKDGELVDVSKKLSMSEIREAFNEYEVAEDCGYIPPDATFVITEKGQEMLSLV